MNEKTKLRIILAIIGAALLAAGCIGIDYEDETVALLKTLSTSSILLDTIHLTPYILVFFGGMMLLAVADNNQSNPSSQMKAPGRTGLFKTGIVAIDRDNNIF